MQMINSVRLCQAFHRISVRNEILKSVCYKSSKSADTLLPLKPKKPMGAYFRFLKTVTPEITHNNAHISRQDVLKKAAEMWNTTDDETKAPFLKEYNRDFQEYVESMEIYNNSLTDEQKYTVQQQFEDQKKKKEKRKMKKLMVDLGKPKKPASGYSLFVAAMGKHKTKQDTATEWLTKVAQTWKSLPKEEKEVYLTQSVKLREAYEHELQKWTEEIMEKTDLKSPQRTNAEKSQKVSDFYPTTKTEKVNIASESQFMARVVSSNNQNINAVPRKMNSVNKISSLFFRVFKKFTT